jgi:hypothetical protein
MTFRPKLASFRVEAFSSDNRTPSDASPWDVKLENTIEIGAAVPTAPGQPIQGVVKLVLQANAHNTQVPQTTAAFRGEYIGLFVYPDEATEPEVLAWIASDDHQYLLSAQTFPLAMSHFRRELLATGFDGRNLPLGL